MWIDTHCHLDAPEFAHDRPQVIARAQAAGVDLIVVPAVSVDTFDTAREVAHACAGAYALGIHPLYVQHAPDHALTRLCESLTAQQDDARLVAIGEIGLDAFVPEWQEPACRRTQEQFYDAQLALAVQFQMPVILHVRRSADGLLKSLRRWRAQGRPVPGGIAHAFNGSLQQAQAFLDLGFKLGFGGAMTYDRALQLRRLASELPRSAVVLETDAPDIPPAWLYKTAAERAAGARSRNEPAELPRIAETLADIWQCPLSEVCSITRANALLALPKLQALMAAQSVRQAD